MAAIRTRRQSWRFGLDLPSCVRGSQVFFLLLEERRSGKVHSRSCTLDSCARFQVERPRKSRLFARRVFSSFSILWKIYDHRSIAETCFSLEKLKSRRKFDFLIDFHSEKFRINLDLIFYDNETIKKVYSIIQMTIIRDLYSDTREFFYNSFNNVSSLN